MKLPANTNRQHALVYKEHYLYNHNHISILEAVAYSKLGITYNNSVYVVKINNDPACDSLPSLVRAQQCWKAFCFQSFTFKQNISHVPLIMLFFFFSIYCTCYTPTATNYWYSWLLCHHYLPKTQRSKRWLPLYCTSLFLHNYFCGLYKNARRISLLAIFSCGTVFASIIEGRREFCKSIFMCVYVLKKIF